MRKMIRAAVAGLALMGGAAAVASTAQAQGYYYGPPVYYGQNGYYQAPSRGYYNNGYAQPYAGYPNSGYYNNGYNGYGNGYGGDSSLAGIAGALLGSVLGNGYQSSNVPYDQYGPDPNGMIAPDGHRIKCKLRKNYDSYYRGYVTRRECR